MRNNGGLVIAQVKRLAAAGTLRPHDVVVPGVLVDVIVVAPDQLQTTHTPYDPAISGEIFRPLSSFETPKFGVAKVIARRVAQELRDGDAVNIGFGISANVPRILIEEGRHGAVTWVIEQGAVGGVPLLDFQFGCASNAEAIVPSPQQFTYFQGGGFDMSLLSFLQIDRDGSVNVSKLGVRPHVTAGAGGFVDITARAKKIVFSGYFTAGAEARDRRRRAASIAKEGKIKKLVEAVEQVSFSGPRAVAQGQESLYVTERCVMRLEREGMTVMETRARRRSEARRARASRIPAARRRQPGDDGRGSVPSRAVRPHAAACRGAQPMSAYVDLAFEGPDRAHHAQARRQAQRARSSDDRGACRGGARNRSLTRNARRDHFRRRQGVLRRRRYRRLGGLPPLEMWRDWTRAGHRAFEALARLRVPLIAALTGHAFGGGLELAAVADIRIAETRDQARPAGDRPRHGAGLVGHAAAGAPLRRRRRPSHGADRADIQRRRGAGVRAGRRGRRPTAKRSARAEALAADVAKRGPVATQIVKAMINAAEGEDRDAPIEGLAGALTAMTEDLAEGVAAFRAKRDPDVQRPMKGREAMTAQTPILLDNERLAQALARFPRQRAMWIDGRDDNGAGELIVRHSPAHGALVTRVPRGDAADADGRSSPPAKPSTKAPGRMRQPASALAYC